jgi:peptide/nickel transport system permease protein
MAIVRLVCNRTRRDEQDFGVGQGEGEQPIPALGFLIRRVVQALVVMAVISLIGFAVKESLGDPLRELLGESVAEAERAALREKFGLNDPFLVQYFRFVVNALSGDLGASYFFKKPALDVILAKLPATFELVLSASVIVAALSLPAGIYCAVRPERAGARAIMAASVVGLSVPVFLTGILAITIFSVQLEWLPSFGRGETIALGPWKTGFLTADGLAHLVLPALTLSSIMLAMFIRLVRGEMRDVLTHDFIRTACAKGAPPLRVWLSHGLRNAAVPIVTLGGLQLGTLLAYTILTETVFQWPGMGFLFLEAVNRADTPLIIAYIMVVGAIFVTVNTLVDVAYVLLDPRVSLTGRDG